MKAIAPLFAVHAVLGCWIAAGLGEEITSASEKRSLAAEMLDKYKADSEAIRTWTGKVDVETTEEYVNDGKKRMTKSTVSFWSDELSTSNKTVREVHEQFEEHADGNRENLVRRNDALLLEDGETYTFPTYFDPDKPYRRFFETVGRGPGHTRDRGRHVLFSCVGCNE